MSEPSLLVLAGGSGTRFWPVSRRDRPKQLLELFDDQTLLQSTVRRLSPIVPADRVWICTTERIADQVAEQVPQVPREQILAEPEARNTAPAISWAVSRMSDDALSEPIVVAHADHFVADERAFNDAVACAVEVARSEPRIVTLGVVPRWAETGYGYLELEQPCGGELRAHPVVRFLEKPPAEMARQFLEGGRHLWNAGYFVFRGDVFEERLRSALPALSEGLEQLRSLESGTAGYAAAYGRLPKISIDHGVMEHQQDLLTVPLDCGWNDVGSWQALAELLEADVDGNRVRGTLLAHGARDNLVFSSAEERSKMVALLGVEGLAVVVTGDAVLVMPRESSQKVRVLIDMLESEGRDDLL